jgi:hypothetical protein
MDAVGQELHPDALSATSKDASKDNMAIYDSAPPFTAKAADACLNEHPPTVKPSIAAGTDGVAPLRPLSQPFHGFKLWQDLLSTTFREEH